MTPERYTRDSAARQIAEYTFLHVFARDGTLGVGELTFLERLALRDGVIDDDERKVLREIFARVEEGDVFPEVWDELQAFKAAHGID